MQDILWTNSNKELAVPLDKISCTSLCSLFLTTYNNPVGFHLFIIDSLSIGLFSIRYTIGNTPFMYPSNNGLCGYFHPVLSTCYACHT